MPSRLTVVLVSLLATPAGIYWLWLVILPARVAILCPEECECDIGGFYVTCKGPSLTNTAPLIRLTDIRVLWLVENNITLIEKHSFVSLTELKILSIEWCRLRTIELGALNGLTKLTLLSISNNKVSDIIPGTFENLNNLEELHLDQNRLQQLDSNVFSGLVNLKYIDLGYNKLQYLHPDTFLGLPNIQYISLYNNPSLQIPTDRNFITSHSLSHLEISGCNVSSVSVETFANVSALELLDLRHNNLRTVYINILIELPKLSKMYLYGNPLQCDCQLLEVWRWCEDRNIETGYGEEVPECDTPSEVKGMPWRVVEKGECLKGNIEYCGDCNNTSCSCTGINDTYTVTETDTDMETQTDKHMDTEDTDTETKTDTDMETEADKYTDTETDKDMNTEDTDTETETDTDMETETDTDTEQNFYDSSFLKQYQVPVYAFPFIFGTSANVILIIIICNKDMRTVPNMYILNLAITDIIYLTALFSEVCFIRISTTWRKNEFVCTFFQFCNRLFVGLSAYSVAVLSIQRYRLTVNPLHFRVSSQATWRVTVATICGVWIVAALFAVPAAISKYDCSVYQTSTVVPYYKRVVIFELLVSCVLPLCVIAFTYIRTARHLVESSRSISEGTQSPQLKTRRNSAKIVVGLTVVFLISYVPCYAFWTYYICTLEVQNYFEHFGFHFFLSTDITSYTFLSDDQFNYIQLISACFLLINPCLNPVALFCTSSPFRQHLKRQLTCFCKTDSPPTDIELARRN